MKTLVQNLFASSLFAIVIASTAFTANASTSADHSTTLRTPANGILKVVVKGNAKVTLVQSEKESVKIIDAYNDEKTSVKMEGGTLVINSYEAYPINITVFVKNPFRIEASNTASVQTKGTFNLQFLQVILKDKASADVNACTKGLYTQVRDKANLKLAGSSDEHIIIRSKVAKLQKEAFACVKTNESYDEFANSSLAIDSVKTVAVSTEVLKSK
ncbi:DUF2807 domain-containing protein [Pedobacter sp. MC2016-14]|uniref:GIN domain-containing protein n=1 Tax=Pedobacter sp. MC2016-14 TaxID=2897327 RepID=UPI001E294AE2|nr:DUF2807 domain-containing protein [Pedobacter sp. MC2016-14]MCD0487140.1 DUF2807 domain-containing protein [Pedobacter sp. MC2016-14]